MRWTETANEYLNNVGTYASTVDLFDVVEILIIAFLLYYILAWMKNTRSWRMLKGLIIIFFFLLIVNAMKMTNIMWIAENVLSFAVMAIIVVMQPELRQALERLGEKSFLPSIGFSDSSHSAEGAFSEKSLNEIVKACMEMGKVKTGALIVIERKESLKDYERTGIEVDGIVTSQLLINIFEHNTPLHDGAVIVRGNRVTYATRHRAGVGVSETTDSLTLIVSEETGGISIAYEGELQRHLRADELKEKMRQIMNMNGEENAKGRHRRKGKSKTKDGKETAE